MRETRTSVLFGVNAKLHAHTRTETQTDTASFLIGTREDETPYARILGKPYRKESEFHWNRNRVATPGTARAHPRSEQNS